MPSLQQHLQEFTSIFKKENDKPIDIAVTDLVLDYKLSAQHLSELLYASIDGVSLFNKLMETAEPEIIQNCIWMVFKLIDADIDAQVIRGLLANRDVQKAFIHHLIGQNTTPEREDLDDTQQQDTVVESAERDDILNEERTSLELIDLSRSQKRRSIIPTPADLDELERMKQVELGRKITLALQHKIFDSTLLEVLAGEKETIAAYILSLSDDKKLALIDEVLAGKTLLGQVFYIQRGIFQPSTRKGVLKRLADEKMHALKKSSHAAAISPSVSAMSHLLQDINRESSPEAKFTALQKSNFETYIREHAYTEADITDTLELFMELVSLDSGSTFDAQKHIWKMIELLNESLLLWFDQDAHKTQLIFNLIIKTKIVGNGFFPEIENFFHEEALGKNFIMTLSANQPETLRALLIHLLNPLTQKYNLWITPDRLIEIVGRILDIDETGTAQDVLLPLLEDARPLLMIDNKKALTKRICHTMTREYDDTFHRYFSIVMTLRENLELDEVTGENGFSELITSATRYMEDDQVANVYGLLTQVLINTAALHNKTTLLVDLLRNLCARLRMENKYPFVFYVQWLNELLQNSDLDNTIISEVVLETFCKHEPSHNPMIALVGAADADAIKLFIDMVLSVPDIQVQQRLLAPGYLGHSIVLHKPNAPELFAYYCERLSELLREIPQQKRVKYLAESGSFRTKAGSQSANLLAIILKCCSTTVQFSQFMNLLETSVNERLITSDEVIDVLLATQYLDSPVNKKIYFHFALLRGSMTLTLYDLTHKTQGIYALLNESINQLAQHNLSPQASMRLIQACGFGASESRPLLKTLVGALSVQEVYELLKNDEIRKRQLPFLQALFTRYIELEQSSLTLTKPVIERISYLVCESIYVYYRNKADNFPALTCLSLLCKAGLSVTSLNQILSSRHYINEIGNQVTAYNNICKSKYAKQQYLVILREFVTSRKDTPGISNLPGFKDLTLSDRLISIKNGNVTPDEYATLAKDRKKFGSALLKLNAAQRSTFLDDALDSSTALGQLFWAKPATTFASEITRNDSLLTQFRAAKAALGND